MNVWETKEGNKSSLKAFDIMSPCSQFLPFPLSSSSFPLPLWFLFIFHFVNCFSSSISSLEYWDVKNISFHSITTETAEKNVYIKNCQLLSICHFRSKDKWTSNNLRIKINTFHHIYSIYILAFQSNCHCAQANQVYWDSLFLFNTYLFH